MIIKLKRFSKIGRTWSGIKGATKSGLKGALYGGAISTLGGIAALETGNPKAAAGILGAGALIGGAVGGSSGWSKGVSEYDLKQKLNSPEGRKELLKEVRSDLVTNAKREFQSAININDHLKLDKKVFIDGYKAWFSKNKVELPNNIINFISGCCKFFTKENIKAFYNDWINSPEKFITEKNIINNEFYYASGKFCSTYLIPEFFQVFPSPLRPETLGDCGNDGNGWIMIGQRENEDAEGVYYNLDKKIYNTTGGYNMGKASLEYILNDCLKFYETEWDVDYTPAQKRVFENYRKLVIQPLK